VPTRTNNEKARTDCSALTQTLLETLKLAGTPATIAAIEQIFIREELESIDENGGGTAVRWGRGGKSK
jgi:hypothetical protein